MKRTIIKKSELKKLVLETIKEMNLGDYLKAADEDKDDSISGPGKSLAKDNSSFIYFADFSGNARGEFRESAVVFIHAAKVKSIRAEEGDRDEPILAVDVTTTTTGGPKELGAASESTFIIYPNSAGADGTLLIRVKGKSGVARVIFYSKDDAEKFIKGVLSASGANDPAVKDLIKGKIPGKGSALEPSLSDPSSLQYIPGSGSKHPGATRAYKAIQSLN